MSKPDSGRAQRWAISGAISLAAGVLVVLLFRAPPDASFSAPDVATRRPVMLRADDGLDVAFEEQKVLGDPTPLFLPTKWNAARKSIARPEPGATFQNYEPSFRTSSGMAVAGKFPPPVVIPDNPLNVLLADRPGALLLGIGRTDRAQPVLSERGAFVEIVTEGTGRAVLRQPLADARPPGDGNWQPMEFMGDVNAMGVVGTLAVTRRSGVEGVDEYFRRYLVETLRVGQRLAPGLYRISIGP